MTSRRSCPPAPGPLEAYAQRLDPLFSSLAQRRGLRDYLQGLLLPRDRNKTLTGLAGAEPIVGAQHREVQRLQWFLSESTWDHQQVNDQRVRLLCQDSATAPNDRGALVLDDTGDRKDGTATAHVARQYLGSVGKIDNGIVAVTSLWADECCYWSVQAVPYTPAVWLPGGERDPGFPTKPQLAVELVQAARQAGVRFRAVVADCFDGDNPGFTDALGAAKVRFVLALKPRRGTWAPADQAHTPVEAAGELGWRGPTRPGRWRRLQRRFGDGHTETWWAADAQLGGWGPDRAAAAGGGHHRPQAAARARDLVSADQPAVSQEPPRPAGRPGCHRAAVRAAQLGRAGLQAGQRRARLGRLPGPIRPGHPPPLDTGVLRVLVLLAGLPRRAPQPTSVSRPPGRRPVGRAGGAGDRASAPNQPSEARGRWRCERCRLG
jgi:DDE superfamily endonuclease